MTKQLRPRFVITFSEKFPSEEIPDMLETGFLGWGTAYSGKDARVLFLTLAADADPNKLKVDLDELQAAGELTYVEEVR